MNGAPISTRGLFARVALASLVVLIALGLWGFVFEPASLRSVTTVLDVPRWPEPCLGLRVAVLADLHVGSPFNGVDKLERIVMLTNRERPDLVLIAGDLVVTGVFGGTFVPPEQIAAVLDRLEPEGDRTLALPRALRDRPRSRGRSPPVREPGARNQHPCGAVSGAPRDFAPRAALVRH